ncbi:DnaJ protein, putative [Babesia microti strain RI]|uniref:DnaJ protein, putative n=1 Tax=Babesia microti (strain RI) TaxID=1133968 RepID=A0A1R4AAQ7_BABMR|nr:DnaJ protein, putative [Babesia microti strain RI]SJK86081.1 DnaJ protein, putative [Babesia microti strain RI]|eukprot:XP_021338277.1 DnaJ protein, putative [Babesia microti strain RI]
MQSNLSGQNTGIATGEEYLIRRDIIYRQCGQFNYYDALELTPSCSQNDIKKQYYKLAKLLHPDKSKTIDFSDAMSYITTAYDVLSDECLRAYYDYDNGLYIGGEIGKSSCLERVKSAVAAKRNAYLSKKIDSYWEYVADRWENGGLIIKKALYGDLSDPSKAIDVTVALQEMIENDELHINENEIVSFHTLPGFFTEIHDTFNTQLYILYIYMRCVHETTVANYSRINLPLKEHKVYFGYIRGPNNFLFDVWPKDKLEATAQMANIISSFTSPYITALTLGLALFMLHKRLKQ